MVVVWGRGGGWGRLCFGVGVGVGGWVGGRDERVGWGWVDVYIYDVYIHQEGGGRKAPFPTPPSYPPTHRIYTKKEKQESTFLHPTVFEEADIVAADRLHQVLGRVDPPQRQLEVVLLWPGLGWAGEEEREGGGWLVLCVLGGGGRAVVVCLFFLWGGGGFGVRASRSEYRRVWKKCSTIFIYRW